mmetsp:Transcript_55640/g.172444  ORF Transcript_55640/g.172444 Transcript_55640/m.172444 type:complete len:198 (-) Transcript_55640:174-767(-)
MAVWGRGRLKRSAQQAGLEIVVHDDSDVEVVRRSSVPPEATKQPQVAGDRLLQEKAAVRLSEALGGHRELAEGIARALVAAGGAEAAPRLRTLLAALRANASLRAEVIRGGTAAAHRLATQDTREWASDGLKAQREAWVRETTAEASQLGGDIRACPECGGRAVIETGSSAAFKMAKSFAHYKCLEVNCGKQSHLAE